MVFGQKPGKKAAKKPKAEKKPKATRPKATRPKARKPRPVRKATEGVIVKKRPTDIYTVMLMMSLGFVFMATLFLVLELTSYDFGFGNLTPWK